MSGERPTLEQLQLEIERLRRETEQLRGDNERLRTGLFHPSGEHTVDVPTQMRPLFDRAERDVNEFFKSVVADPSKGYIEIGSERYVLLRGAALSCEFFELMDSLFASENQAGSFEFASRLLYDLAHSVGKADALSMQAAMGLESQLERLSAGPAHFAYIGWSTVAIDAASHPSPDDDYFLLYDHPFSFEADAWLRRQQAADDPVCVMNAGYSSGWCEQSFGIQLETIEIACRARGDDFCRFIMAPPDRIAGHVEDYLHEHPELGLKPPQTERPDFFVRNLIERRRSEVALRESEELNRRMVEVMAGGILQITRDGNISHANAEACRVLGYSSEEITKRSLASFDGETYKEDGSPYPREERPAMRCIQTGESQPPTTMGIRRPDGAVIWIVVTAAPILDPSTEEPKGTILAFMDVTENKQVEEVQRRSQKLESLGVLAGGIAHDFNNILSVIMGNTELVRGDLTADAESHRDLDEVMRACQRAKRLVDQILTFGRHGEGQMKPMEIKAECEECLSLLRASLPSTIEIKKQFHEDVGRIEGDPVQIHQALLNLGTNAAHAMGEGGGRLEVALENVELDPEEASELGEAHAGPHVRLTVTDSGDGISEDLLTRIYDPFFTTKSVGEGTGLGLSVVHGIVTRHHGAIRVDSRPGIGTSFELYFPRVDTALPEFVDETLTTGNSRNERVLFVDDEAELMRLGEVRLERLGYDVTATLSGPEALQLFLDAPEQFDIVVTDQTMSGLTGLELAEEIHAVRPEVPVVLTTGYSQAVIPEAASERGVVAVLLKPYSMKELSAIIREALQPTPTH